MDKAEKEHIRGKDSATIWDSLKTRIMKKIPHAEFRMCETHGEYGVSVTGSGTVPICAVKAEFDRIMMYFTVRPGSGILPESICRTDTCPDRGFFPETCSVLEIKTMDHVHIAISLVEAVWRHETGHSRIPVWEHLEI